MTPLRSARAALLVLGLALGLTLVPLGAGAQTDYLTGLEGNWNGTGRAATNAGEAAIACNIESNVRRGRLTLQAGCNSQGQSGRIGMQLYYSEMTRQFHGELSSPLNYIRGQLVGRLDRGDLFLRLDAEDGSQGRLLLVDEGEGRIRLLVTTVVDGANITILDLPLAKTA
ncbi:MAG: hypothetical protein KI785_05030 [Devosiaceae bacterium]|nr:hypothetical protein [Devosiaceae bacterium MH13]